MVFATPTTQLGAHGFVLTFEQHGIDGCSDSHSNLTLNQIYAMGPQLAQMGLSNIDDKWGTSCNALGYKTPAGQWDGTAFDAGDFKK